MKKLVQPFRLFVILLYVTISFSSCSQLPDYDLVEDGDDFSLVTLHERVSVKDLKAIATEVKNKKGAENCMILFFVPSIYPYYPNEPWASMTFYENDEVTGSPGYQLQIHGARSNEDVKQLKGIIPADASPLKVWYHHHPIQEGLVVMERYLDGIELKFYHMPEYHETDNSADAFPNEEISKNMYFNPDLREQYACNATLTEFRNKEGKLIYYIDDQERLVRILTEGIELFMDPIE